MADLKPCPFCGDKHPLFIGNKNAVVCRGCGGTMSKMMSDEFTGKTSDGKWNRREELSRLQAKLEEVRALAQKWRDEAMAAVPEDYAARNLHGKYFRLDNHAAGQECCADELEQVISD